MSFNKYPYTDFHELNTDWMLKKFKEIEETQIDVINSAKNATKEWLDAHPEATTTVVDNSLLTTKFKHSSIPFYCVTDYGIEPGTGDVYEKLYNFIKEVVVANGGGTVYFPAGLYELSYTIIIPSNVTFLGAGRDTIIKFTEEDRTYGTALGTCSHDITIANMTVNSNDYGTFDPGAQNGSIGISNVSDHYWNGPAFSHDIPRVNEVFNISVINVWCDTKYVLQVEPTPGATIRNILYKNIFAPNSTISLTPDGATGGGIVENVVIDNFDCAHLRLGFSSGNIKNVSVSNGTFGRMRYDNKSHNNNLVSFKNLTQKTGIRLNTDLDSDICAWLIGDALVENCIFNANPEEVKGVMVGQGIVEFSKCIFNGSDKVMSRRFNSDNDYIISNDCIYNSPNATQYSLLVGYGKNNQFNHRFIKSLLWGDIHTRIENIGITSATPYFENGLYIDGDNIRIDAQGVITANNNLFTLPDAIYNFPIRWKDIDITVYTQDNRDSTTQRSWGAAIDNVMQITDPTYSGYTSRNRVWISQQLTLTRKPTPSELIALLA